jgi:pyruvate dehydrogenase E2 component (dihydrolipoamide acetyltransferase)
MATNIIMPSLGFDMTEGKLANWLKKEGDRVERGQAIAEIETEKATVEIESTVAGTLQKILVPANQTVPVGTVVALIAEPGEKAPAVQTPGTSLPEPVKATPTKAASISTAPEKQGGNGGGAALSGERIKASPLARRMAQAAGINLAQIKGTGPGGRIMERDVKGASTAPSVATAPAQPSPATAPRPAEAQMPGAAPVTPGMGTPLNKMRQAIARRMTESKTTVPHFYVTTEINMTAALNVRAQLNAMATEADKISVNDLVVAAAAKTLLQFPNLNSSYRDGTIERHSQINIGIAVALEEGLITPVLHDADKKSIKVIAAESKAMGERAHANKLRADDLGGGTFTISNLGMFGVDEFVAIINPPEAAILAVGAAVRRPIVADGDVVQVAAMMKVTISVDHRVGDGAQAARFLQALKKLLENPVNLLI